MEISEFLRGWGWALAIGLNLFIAWVGWTFRSHFVTRDRLAQVIDGLAEQSREHDIRLTRVEEQLKAAPSHADLARLHDRLDQIYKDVSQQGQVLASVDSTARALARSLDMLNEHHLHRARETAQ